MSGGGVGGGPAVSLTLSFSLSWWCSKCYNSAHCQGSILCVCVKESPLLKKDIDTYLHIVAVFAC